MHTPIEDVEAELQVVAAAIASVTGSTLAHQRLTADQFSRPHLARLFAVTPHLPTVEHDYTNPDNWDQPNLDWRRAAEAAVATDIDDRDVTELIATRSTAADSTGYWANRVAAAAKIRQAALELTDVLADLANGANPAEVADVIVEAAILLKEAA